MKYLQTAATTLALISALTIGPLGTPGAAGTINREPQVAGAFYPDDPRVLKSWLAEGFAGLEGEDPENFDSSSKPRIIISPHAGYRYSGKIALQAFAAAKDYDYERVVLIGFTHQQQFPGSSVDRAASYETPVGSLKVDVQAAEELRRRGLGYEASAHESTEHSLEVLLPFVRYLYPETPIIPILMGSFDQNAAEALADQLYWLSQQRETLFVFSTDLSHYHEDIQARRRDALTLQHLTQETPYALARSFRMKQSEACGRGPLIAASFLSAKLGYLRPKLLKYGHSGEVPFGNPNRVVGYAALAYYPRSSGDASENMSPEAGQALVKLARNTLEKHFDDTTPGYAVDTQRFPELEKSHGAFVTLEKKGNLRGCIGHITTDRPLIKTIPIVALQAALNDRRFDPVESSDLPNISVEVSVLTEPRAVTTIAEIVPGRDGVVLEYKNKRGVFLPSVWESTGWTRAEFLQALAEQKAGISADLLAMATFYTFRDQVFEEDPAAVH